MLGGLGGGGGGGCTRSITVIGVVQTFPVSLMLYEPLNFRILEAPPTAELEPLEDGKLVQTDEVKTENFF